MNTVNKWVSLHTHSANGSLMDAVSKTADIVSKCAKYEQSACAISDHGALHNIPPFHRECRKQGIKPLLGIEFYVCDNHSSIKDNSNRSLSHLVILAKNLSGWKTLLKLVAKSNSEESYYYKNRLSLEEIAEINTDYNLIGISAHPGSTLNKALWKDEKSSFNATSYQEAKDCAHTEDWYEVLSQAANRHIEAFGKENFFVEIQRMDEERLYMAQVSAKAMRAFAKKFGLKTVATADPHYVEREDAVIQRIALCNSLKTTLSKVHSKLNSGEDVPLGGFFKSSNYYMLTPDEMAHWHTEEEMKNSLLITDMIEDYEIEKPTQVPYYCDDPNKELRQQAIEGFKDMVDGKVDETTYRNRMNYELDIIEKCNISDYFLILSDITRWCRENEILIGMGRGSVAGSITAMLTGITHHIDPIEDELPFERFITEERVKKSYPDVDLDIESNRRNEVMEYVVDKYGKDRVAQVATFHSLKGRSALRAVLRVMDYSFRTQMEVTEHILEESKVTDDLEEFAEETGEKSLIKLSLRENAEKLAPYAKLEKDGSISGEYSEAFDYACRLEWSRSHLGMHAAAVIIGKNPLVEDFPMIRTSSKNIVVGLDYTDAEKMGGLKMDLLSLKNLSVLSTMSKL